MGFGLQGVFSMVLGAGYWCGMGCRGWAPLALGAALLLAQFSIVIRRLVRLALLFQEGL